MNARTAGPSLSRKKVLKIANVRKKTSDVMLWIPSTAPCSSVSPVWDAPLSASLVVLDVPPAPASFAQPSILSTACERDCGVLPLRRLRSRP